MGKRPVAAPRSSATTRSTRLRMVYARPLVGERRQETGSDLRPRSTFASNAFGAGVSILALARIIGTSALAPDGNRLPQRLHRADKLLAEVCGP